MNEETGVLEPSQQATTESTQQTGTEAELEQTSTESSEAEGLEAEQAEGAETTDDDPNWLPDEQLKEFPAEVVARYAKRFGYTPEEIAADHRLAKSLSKMINSDIYINQLKEQEGQEPEGEEEEGEPTAEEAKPQEWEGIRDAFVEQVTDPKIAQATFTALNEATKKAPQDGGVEFIKVLSKAAVNLMRDAIPALLYGANGQPGALDRYLETRYEGLSGTVQQTSRSSAWNELVASDAKYSKLPQYDPRPNSDWHKAISRVAQIVPGFEKFNITGASPLQNFRAKAMIAANLLSAGLTPEAQQIATKAVETGKRVQKDSDRQKSLANLGAGRTKGALQQKSDDPLEAEIAKFNAGNRPLQSA